MAVYVGRMKETSDGQCSCAFEAEDREQMNALRWLLTINGVMFLGEFGAGLVAGSTALIADSLDMFADAAVYFIGLFAVGKGVLVKVRAALLSGILQIILAFLALTEVARRAFVGNQPEPAFMILVGLAALVANVTCLSIISKHRRGEVHMRASWIFSTNDVIANLGVVSGGALVYFLGNRWPDLLIGLIVGVVVLRGGVQIVKEANKAKSVCLTG